MQLEQHGAKVTGSYRYGSTDGQIDGRVRGSLLRLRYSEGAQSGSGEFRLLRYGKFSGFYIPEGQKTPHPWEGHRGWDGLWETDFGRLRMIQECDRVLGSYTGAADSELRGRDSGGRLAFRYKETNASGEGRFTLAGDGAAFSGEWRPAGRGEFRPWNTTRVDWSASALLEFAYLDLLLNRGMPPEEAAAALPKLMPYAGARAPRGSPYPAAGFRYFAAR